MTICNHDPMCLFDDVVDGEMRLNALGRMCGGYEKGGVETRPHVARRLAFVP